MLLLTHREFMLVRSPSSEGMVPVMLLLCTLLETRRGQGNGDRTRKEVNTPNKAFRLELGCYHC